MVSVKLIIELACIEISPSIVDGTLIQSPFPIFESAVKSNELASIHSPITFISESDSSKVIFPPSNLPTPSNISVLGPKLKPDTIVKLSPK